MFLARERERERDFLVQQVKFNVFLWALIDDYEWNQLNDCESLTLCKIMMKNKHNKETISLGD